MNITLLPSLGTAISEIPAKGLGLVLKSKVHMLPLFQTLGARYRKPRPSREAASVSGRSLSGHPALLTQSAPSTSGRAAGDRAH